MNRSRLVSLVVAVLAVLALAAGAAVIDAPTATQGAGGGSGGGSGGFFGSGSDFSLGGSSVPPPTTDEFPRQLFGGVLALLAVVSVVLFVLLRDEFDLASLRRVVLGGVGIAALLGVVYLAIQLFGGDTQGGQNGTGTSSGGVSLPGGGSGGTADTALQPVSTNLPVVALAVGAVLLVGLAVVSLSRGGDDDERDPEPESGPPSVAGIGRAAGRAADRIAEDASLENEVYRAWREMTGHLDVANPASSTPGEFARAATDAGMEGDDVDELTDLFTRVRYGDAGVTGERERRAVAALRRIEDTYTEEP